jgi:DNA-binding HxlR family transcriptional regulator
LTDGSVNGNGSRGRSGARVLILLAIPLNGTILTVLSDGPKPLVDLRVACGSPAQTTLRAHLRELEEIGAVTKRRGNAFPGVIECELTGAGQELLFVAATLERWLQAAPQGPLRFGGDPGKAAIRALVDSWSSTMLRALAARPLSLTELDGVIESVSYPGLQRRLAAMRVAGLVEACPVKGRGTNPYKITAWLRQGIAPLAAAIYWERRHLPGETAPIAAIDIEAGFLLSLPLLRLPAELSGSCRLGVETARGGERRLAGAMVSVEDGRIASLTVRLNGRADAWTIGSAGAWLQAVIDSDTDGLELGGDQRLARVLLDRLHRTLFGSAARPELDARPLVGKDGLN